MAFFAWIAKLLGGGLLDRALDTVDRKISAETDKEAIKGEIIKTFYANRAAWMKAGGFWLMVMFAAPLAIWFGAVVLYSLLWCADCIYPQSWTIAALPAPLDDWGTTMIVSIFGVIGVTQIRG
jgi:hypothetical protein